MAIAVFALVTLGTSAKVRAEDWMVRIDNKTTDNYEWAKSGGTVSVCLYFGGSGGGFTCSAGKTLHFISNNHDFNFDPDTRPLVQVLIQFSAPNQTDLLVVDQFELWRIDNPGMTLIFSRGVDNTTGHCFSSQSSDFSDSHCSDSTLYPDSLALFP
jgi:hypothetical protein